MVAVCRRRSNRAAPKLNEGGNETKPDQPPAINRLLSDYFDEICQFLPGIEVYPFAGLVQISQAPVFLALNPDQVLVIWIQPAAGAFWGK
jgi:hypothetical protein